MEPITPYPTDWLPSRGRVAALSRSREPGDPDLIAARVELRATRLAAYIERVVDEAPELSAEQRSRLALLLTGGGGHA